MKAVCANCEFVIIRRSNYGCRARPLGDSELNYVTGILRPTVYALCERYNNDGGCTLFKERREHDVLYVFVDPALVSGEDKERLDGLGFAGDDELESFSYYC